MKTFQKIGMLAVLVLAASNLGAQIILTPTTITANVTSSAQTIVVSTVTPNGSTTGALDNFAAPGNGVNGTGVVIEGEYMLVRAVSGKTISVIRGQSGTTATAHASGALAWSALPNHLSTKNVPQPAGGCTRTNEVFLPVVNAVTQTVADCLGGVWVRGNLTELPQSHVYAPDPGGTAYTGINTNGTAVGATTLYCTEMNLRTNKLLTGLAVLNGTTVTANARYVILYDAAGNVLANSALTGQASGTASVYETYAFTGKFFAVGPAQYFACLQDNSTGSTTVRMAVTGQADQVLTKGQTNATFGTIPALVPPTTFASAVGPYFSAY